MGGLITKRWTRGTLDRLYVSTTTGHRVGWMCLKTFRQVLEDQSLADEFRDAIAPFLPTTLQMPPPSGPPLLPGAMAPGQSLPNEVPDGDLLDHRPGELARERADQEAAKQGRVRHSVARLFDSLTDERSWRLGAEGEESVGERLDRLTPDGWTVLHSVPVGYQGSDIDHVLIGPGGVFTVNTKNHPGGRVWVGEHAIKVNGRSVPYLRNARYEAERAGGLLSAAVGFQISVRAVLVILTGTLIPQITVKQRPSDVGILDRMDIPGAFRRAPVTLQPEHVAALSAVARRPSTWR